MIRTNHQQGRVQRKRTKSPSYQQELFSHSKWRQIKTIFKPCFLTLSWIRDLSVLSHAFCSRRHTRKCVVCAGTGSPWGEIKEPYHQKPENDSDSYWGKEQPVIKGASLVLWLPGRQKNKIKKTGDSAALH